MIQIVDYSTDIIPILSGRLIAMHAQHVFVVHGMHSYKACGAESVMSDVFDSVDAHVTSFTGFSVNPKMEEVECGVEQVLRTRPDVIIAIGGGSAMDVAKLIRHYAAQRGYRIPLWVIPTTAGTGAEATHFAVVYVNNEKKSIDADDILPDVAILYPPFTYDNDAYLTACTGFDALAQAIESFWNPNATNESDMYALRAIAHIHRQLLTCVHNMDVHYLRDDLLLGAYYAGRAINITKTTAPHAFSYAFTTHCGYPHGHAVAITFPFFAKLNMTNHPKNEELRWVLGVSKETDLQEYFLAYVKSIGLGYKGTKEKDLHTLLRQVNLERLKNNPVEMNNEKKNELENFIKSSEV